MAADLVSYKRLGGLKTQRMPGGDLAAIYPARMVAGMMWDLMERNEIEKLLRERCSRWFKRGDLEIDAVLIQLERNLNVNLSSSCGRVLDAVSCLLGICGQRTYEGEPAMKLEAVAAGGNPNEARLKPEIVSVDGKLVFDTSKLLIDVLSSVRENLPVKHIAASAQSAIARGLVEIAIEVAEAEGIRDIGCSGGVFYNRMITEVLRREIECAGLRFFRHERLPCGDGCISAGQAISAVKRTRLHTKSRNRNVL